MIDQFDKLWDQLNSAQQKAVQHSVGPALILAGAGSGKTRVLIMRAAYLIKKMNILPEQILLVTFTNKAALEIKKRLFSLIGDDFPHASTFHSFSAFFLRKYGHYLRLDNNFLIYDSQDQADLIKVIIKEKNIENLNYRKVKAIISGQKNKMISAVEYQKLAHNDFQEIIAQIYFAYERKLRENSALDFDDLLLKMVELLANNSLILEKMQTQFKHILVDEYQDTNRAQYLLSKLLSQSHQNLYVVGDFAQSIYGFRGADYRNLSMLKKNFPHIKHYYLEQNYRSIPSVLKAASCVIKQSLDCPILNLWTNNKCQDKLKLMINPSSSDEAKNVVQLIEQEQKSQNMDLNEIVILYRTNAQSRIFEEALIRENLPYHIVGGFKFYDRKEIKDLLAYIRLLVNPKDSLSLKRMTKLGKRKTKLFLEWKEKFKLKISNDWSNCQLKNHEIMTEIMQIVDYKAKFDPNDNEDLARLENIDELLNVMSSFDNLLDFLENVSLIQDGYFNKNNGIDRDQGVNLMTLHSAKGLEFKIVFLVGFEEGLVPHENSLFDQKQIEEERRLCYVGITRAKEKLFLSYCQNRWTYNGNKKTQPSRFLKDLENEKDLLENLNFCHSKVDTSKEIFLDGGQKLISDDDYFKLLLDKKIEWSDDE